MLNSKLFKKVLQKCALKSVMKKAASTFSIVWNIIENLVLSAYELLLWMKSFPLKLHCKRLYCKRENYPLE